MTRPIKTYKTGTNFHIRNDRPRLIKLPKTAHIVIFYRVCPFFSSNTFFSAFPSAIASARYAAPTSTTETTITTTTTAQRHLAQSISWLNRMSKGRPARINQSLPFRRYDHFSVSGLDIFDVVNLYQFGVEFEFVFYFFREKVCVVK